MLKNRCFAGTAAFACGLMAALSATAQTVFPANPDETIPLVATTAHAGQFATGEAYLVRSGDKSHAGLRCPVIVVEGFDRDNTRNWPSLRNDLMQDDFGLKLLRAGRDLLLLNFTDGTTYIQDNGHVLTALLQHVNANRHDPAEPMVVLGFSMGGLVGRYSLAWCEDHGVNHGVDVFVSFDSPQEGANVPLGVQEAVKWMYDFCQDNSEYLSASDIAVVTALLDSQNCRASRQMNLCHYQTAANGQRAGADPLRVALVNELTAMGNYPTLPHKVAISNGSGHGTTLGFQGGDRLGHLEYIRSQSVFGFKVTMKLTMDVYAVSATPVRVFEADVDWSAINSDEHSLSTKYAAHPFDAAPGAFTDSMSSVQSAVPDGATFVMDQDRQCFIPTFSSLGLPASRLFDDFSADPNLLENSPFDEISYAVDNEEHVELNERTYGVLLHSILGGEGTALGELDLDQDGLPDRDEFDLGTLGWKPDSENDGMPDGWEVIHELDPLADDAGQDEDYDLLTNLEEYRAGSNPRTEESIVWHDATERLGAIGQAILDYRAARRGLFPDSLGQLVSEGYLAAGILLCDYDPSAGTDPHPYDEDAYVGGYEPGSSFLYLFSNAAHPAGGTWRDQWTAAHDATSLPDSAFPVVQCFHALPAPAEAEAGQATVLTLAYDLATVFATRGDWEAEPPPGGSPVLRAGGEIACPLGGAVAFPLWSPWQALPGTFRFELLGARAEAALDGRFLLVSLDEAAPSPYAVTVNLLRDGFVLDTREYRVRPARRALEIELAGGWNLLGFPLAPGDDPVQLIDGSRDGALVRAPQFWDTAVPAYTATLPEGVTSPGFWIYADVGGTAVASAVRYAAPARELPAGWNLVGTDTDMLLPECANLDACYIWNPAMLRYERVRPGETVRAGRGHWLHLSAPCVFDPATGSLEPVVPTE